MATIHNGRCYCVAIEIEASGEPIDMGYCHCEACRKYSGMPVSAFTWWKPDNVRVPKGRQFLGKFRSSEMSDRQYCTKCGGNVMADHPTLGLIDIPAGVLPTLAFRPTAHLNYEDTVLPMRDGLPKLRDFPSAIGGSGQTMPE
jgi:hypothetical protein